MSNKIEDRRLEQEGNTKLLDVNKDDFYKAYNSDFFSNLDKYRDKFATAKPFRHLYITDFLNNQLAEELYSEFPRYSKEDAVGESGHIELSSIDFTTYKNKRSFNLLNKLTQSTLFLNYMRELTGIKDLMFAPHSPDYEVKQSLSGEQMDPHIDMNYHYNNIHHRRLNLIVYLNKNWEVDFGGNIELHSNPKIWWKNDIKILPAAFNTAVLFETNEHSWHGFSEIKIPEGHSETSRKSLALYFYSPTRKDSLPPHTTIWVPRSFDRKKFAPGVTLTEDLQEELAVQFARRDGRIELLYDLIRQLQEELYEQKK